MEEERKGELVLGKSDDGKKEWRNGKKSKKKRKHRKREKQQE